MKNVLSLFCVLMSGLLPGATNPEIYTRWVSGGKSSPKEYDWTDADGNPVEMQNNGTEYAVITNMVWSQAFNSGCNWNLYGLCLDNADRSYADGSGILGIQRGGLKCTQACRFAMAGNSATTFKLIAGPQTWEGPESGEYASIGTGDDIHNQYPAYHKGKVTASSDVYDWTVCKRLALWMFYKNDLSHVRLRLESPARIYLPTAWGAGTVLSAEPKLGVKQLTLAGEDVMWQAGVMTEAKLPMLGIAPSGVLNPMMDTETVAEKLVLEDGADVEVENAVWNIPELAVNGSGAESAFIGDMTFAREDTAVALADGARLVLAGVNREGSGISAGLTVSGTGTLVVDPDGWELTGTLTLGENVDLEISGAKNFTGKVSGGGALLVNPGEGGYSSLDRELFDAMSGNGIKVVSGTLCLSSMASLPDNTVIEVASGAAVVFASDEGYDSSRIAGDGAANVTFDETLVTDAVVSASEIVVYTNKVLSVAGDGLTASTTVRLAGGTLRFLTTATVASPVRVDVGSFIEAAGEDVVGTVAGAVTSACRDSGRDASIPVQYGSGSTATLKVNGVVTMGPGTVVYAGGGSFATARDVFVVTRDAKVKMTNGDYSFNGRGDKPLSALVRVCPLVGQGYGYGRYLTVCDGGNVTFKAQNAVNECIYVSSPKNGSLYNKSPWVATFEIGEGGTVTVRDNGRVRIGSVDSLSELKLSGGVLDMASATARFFVGNHDSTYGDATAAADVKLESGTLSLAGPIIREKGGSENGNRSTRCRLLWSGGTLKLNEYFNSHAMFDLSDDLKNFEDERVRGYLRQIVRISGENCTLDLSETGCASVTNVPAGLNQSEWYGTGRLTVTGGKEFVMNSFPDSVDIRTAGTGTRVTVPEGAHVYSAEECGEYFDNSMYDNGSPYDILSTSLGKVTVPTLVSAGTNCTFAVTHPTLPLDIEAVQVSGEWNNARSVSAAGGVAIGDMTFAEGSLLSAAFRNGGTVCQNIDGKLSLPSSVFVRKAPDAEIAPGGCTALAAAGGVEGSPLWIGVGRCRAVNDEDSVDLVLGGMTLILR